MTTEKPVKPFDLVAAAECVALWPEVCDGLLAHHVAGPDGRCQGCRLATQLAPPWPCTLRILGAMATDIRTRAATRRR
jgi:hypothetical protein